MLASSIMTVSNLRLENLESTKDLANVVATRRQVSEDCFSSSLSDYLVSWKFFSWVSQAYDFLIR